MYGVGAYKYREPITALPQLPTANYRLKPPGLSGCATCGGMELDPPSRTTGLVGGVLAAGLVGGVVGKKLFGSFVVGAGLGVGILYLAALNALSGIRNY